MRELKSDRTLIVVAHRLSTVADLDHILVMKDGEIIEYGKHNELLELNGTYALLWQKQLEMNNKGEGESSNSD